MEASRFSTPSNVRSPLRGGVMAKSTGSFLRRLPSRMFLMLIFISFRLLVVEMVAWQDRQPAVLGAIAPIRVWERNGENPIPYRAGRRRPPLWGMGKMGPDVM